VTSDELRELLGHDALLLHCKRGTKKPAGLWGQLTVADMTPEYLQKLENGNIGVALGAKSGNLVALDVDDDAMVEPFLTSNPFLNTTLQTRGARGRVFWLRMDGEYPAVTVKLKTGQSGEIGEWRAGTNSQSIIQGIHPDTRQPYQILNKVRPLSLDFARFHWPADILNPPRIGRPVPDCTEGQRDTHTELQKSPMLLCPSVDSVALPALSSPSLCTVVKSVEHAVELSLPDKTHQNHGLLFKLARAIKGLEKQSGTAFTPGQLREVFARWFTGARDFLRSNKTRDDYQIEFMNAYASAKLPLGEGAIVEAWKKAQENPLPPEAIELFQDTRMRLTIALCRELQIVAGEEPFYLSARTLQGLLELETHTTAAAWLRSLCVQQILSEIEKGSGYKASRYRYVPAIQSKSKISIPKRTLPPANPNPK
jgi:hypothetical protein